ncbi:hypothetical protein F5884DRAFT_404943 [Xylogone sp. PMI_703]|nr:hypothetical protein F5884DRAFT_404943 [Xylogone sp. PMI_703]
MSINFIAAERCLNTFYLSCPNWESQEQHDQNEQDSFYQYCTAFLAAHLEELWIEEMETIPENTKFQEFFSGTRRTITSSPFDLWIQTIDRFHHHRRHGQYELLSFVASHEYPCQATHLGKSSLIFVSAYFGLLPLLHRALDCGQNLLSRSSNGKTAFQLACGRGNFRAAQLLLSQISERS